MKHSTIGKTFAIAAVTTVTLGLSPIAKADNKGCSNATLKGTFAHIGTGFTTAPPAMAGPLAGVGTDTFDGNGNITGTASLSLNGNIVSAAETGTYKVNPDCTGTYTVQFSVGGSTSAFFVIADSGMRFTLFVRTRASSLPTSSGGNFQQAIGDSEGFPASGRPTGRDQVRTGGEGVLSTGSSPEVGA